MMRVGRVAYLHVVHFAGQALIRVQVLYDFLPLRLGSSAKGDAEGQLSVAANCVVIVGLKLADLIDLARYLERLQVRRRKIGGSSHDLCRSVRRNQKRFLVTDAGYQHAEGSNFG